MGVRITITILAVCVLLVGLTVADSSHADARRSPGDAGAPSERFIEEQAEQLGLDQPTLTALRAIADASRARGEPLRAELHAAYAHMRALLSEDLPDEDAVMRQAEAIGALELAKRKNRLQAMLRIRALLTPAQRQQLMRLQATLPGHRWPEHARACQADSANLCSHATHGRARLQCLHDHLEELSEPCRAALQTR